MGRAAGCVAAVPLPPAHALPGLTTCWLLCCCPQGRHEDLRSVVEHLRNRFNVKYIYCWHGGCQSGGTGMCV